jgi:hypothetical protein
MFRGVVSVVDAARTDRPGQFRVLVVPGPDDVWPTGFRLRQGVRSHGWILLGVVPLGFEVWRRFNAFPPRPPEAREAPSTIKNGWAPVKAARPAP